jgi:hypothetical protein
MKKFIKELAWKVPICMAWFQCTPFVYDESLNFWGRCTICGLFILGLDIVRWGLKKD